MPYILPQLRSKYLTYELLKWRFSHIHEVIIFLRSLNNKSRNFLKAYLEEIKDPDNPMFLTSSIMVDAKLLIDELGLGNVDTDKS